MNSYVSVAQAEHETPYADTTGPDSQSPELPQTSFRPLSLEFERLTGDVSVIDPTTNPTNNSAQGVRTILKSLSSSARSYDLVEEDDYEEQATPRKDRFDLPSSTSDQAPVRTASVSRHLPLSQPTPDLQSLQGAYIKNVERLEESAERLSVTSSIGEEIEKMKAEQRDLERRASGASSHAGSRKASRREVSTSSLSNSIIGVNNAARSGGYSPSGYITSPTGSIRSASWAQRPSGGQRASKNSRLGLQGPDPEFEQSPINYEPDSVRPVAANVKFGANGALVVTNENPMAERPATSGSNDMSQQGDDPFADFDGAHYSRTSLDHDGASRRRISLTHPPLARDSKVYKEQQPGEKMIYYPAPVPVMLNLPTRLSKANFGEMQKRRLQALSTIPDDKKMSAAWIPSEGSQSPPERPARSNLKLPPQLRASAFFDQPSQTQNLELKDGSAVQTLDSILDAAAHAPVSAFTDHPIAGRVSKDFYAPEESSRKSTAFDRDSKRKTRGSLGNMLKRGKSSDNLKDDRESRITSRESKILSPDGTTPIDELDEAAANSIAPGEDEIVEDEQDEEEGEELQTDEEEVESMHRPGFSEAPTTLLAELQLRKAQQKQRNRTAADAFPNGMHSTLLELDAVTQLQLKSRRQKHVTLAWEDQEAADRENFDDEEIPLGVLFPEKDRAQDANSNRPMGLMERREMEDNEPLSHRRARLRGEELHPPPSHVSQTQADEAEVDESKYKLDLPGESTELDEQEEETLAQRIKRMKAEKEKAKVGNFASDLTSELGLNTEAEKQPDAKPEAEETLGQRRKRLREEAQKTAAATGARPGLTTKRSMADILQAHPVGQRQVSGESANSNGLQRLNPMGMPHLPPHMQGYYNHQPYMQPMFNASQGMFGMQSPQMGYGLQHPQFGMQGYGIGINLGDGPPMTKEQRGVIDRWRQGVV